MNTTPHPWLVGWALLFAAPTTLAAIANGAPHLIASDANSASSGELFLNVWDAAGARSYSIDLGVTIEALLTKTGSRTWYLDPRFKNFAASGRALQFNIAANNTYGGIAAPALGTVPSTYGIASSVVNISAALTQAKAMTGKAGTGLQQLSSPIQARANHLNLSAAAANGLVPGDNAVMTNFTANLSEITAANNDPYSAYFPTLWGVNLSNRFAFSTAALVRDPKGAKDQTVRLFFFGLQGPGINKIQATDIGGGRQFGLDANNATLSWSSGGTFVDNPPVARPGGSRTVKPGVTVTLNGSASYDPDPGDKLSHVWLQTSGPPVTLTGATTAKASFKSGIKGGIYGFRLTVTDLFGKSASGSLTITVQ